MDTDEQVDISGLVEDIINGMSQEITTDASLQVAQGIFEVLSSLTSTPPAASKVPAKRRGTPIRPTVDRLCSAAYEHGLLPEPLSHLIDLLTRPSYLDQASLGALARNLYPAAAVTRDAVLRIVGCLGIGELKPSLPLQAVLLKWLVMVYHVIDAPGIFSRAYPVLFNLLDVAAIRSVAVPLPKFRPQD